MTAKEYEELKQQVAELESAQQRSQGAIRELKRRLLQDFKVDSLEAGLALLQDKEQKLKSLERKVEVSLRRFKRKWKELSNGSVKR